MFYRDLKVWQKSMDLVVETYQITKLLPKDELYSLTSQIRRAVVSVPSNIAEGSGRRSTRDYIHFLRIANGSVNELETQLLICVRLGYLDSDDIQPLLALSSEIGRMLNAMIQKLTTE